jgi:hypothetical protein
MALIAVRDPGGNFVCRGTGEQGSGGAEEQGSGGAEELGSGGGNR